MASHTASIIFKSRGWPIAPAAAAAILRISSWTRVHKKGPTQMAITASIPNTPTALRTAAAPTMTVSEASAIMLPTTGTTPDRDSFMVLTSVASAEPATNPVTVR